MGWIMFVKSWNELSRDVVEADILQRFLSKLKIQLQLRILILKFIFDFTVNSL